MGKHAQTTVTTPAVQYGAEGSVLRSLPTQPSTAEGLLKEAVWWIDSAHSSANQQTVENLGWSGPILNARCGSTATADSNDPKYLDWQGENYVYLPGVAGNQLSVPDAADIRITGDLDVRVCAQLDSWTPSAVMILASKHGITGDQGWYLRVETDGTIRLQWSSDGSTNVGRISTVSTGLPTGARKWIRATLDVDNGASGHNCVFYTSDDGSTWTQLGSTVTTAGTTSIFASVKDVQVGSANGASSLAGRVYRAQILNGIDGTPVLDIDTSVLTSGSQTSFRARTGQTVTINRSTSGRKAVVVTNPLWLFGTDDYMEVTGQYVNSTAGTVFTFQGGSGYLRVPDETALDVTNLDVRARVALNDWTPSTATTLISRMNPSSTTGRSFRFRVNTDGTLSLIWSPDGTEAAQITATSTVATGISDNAIKWVRATLDCDNGASGYDAKFYLSDNGTTWTQLGTTVTGAGTTTVFAGSEPLDFGGFAATESLAGKMYRAQYMDAIDGTAVVDVFPSGTTAGATSFVCSTGQTVTLNGTARVSNEGGLYLPGLTNNYASAPDSAALSITGDITIDCYVQPTTWRPSAEFTLAAKWGNGLSYIFTVQANGRPRFFWTTDGTAGTQIIQESTAALPNDSAARWVRASLDVDNGSGGYSLSFWTSNDGTAWTQLGTTVTGGTTTSIFDGPALFMVGSYGAAGGNLPANGVFYRTRVYASANGSGSPVFDADFTNKTPTTNSFTESSSNAATVTINRSGTSYVSTLVPSSGYVLPTGVVNFQPATYSLLDFGQGESFTVVMAHRQWDNAINSALIAKRGIVSSNLEAGWFLATYTQSAGVNRVSGHLADGSNITASVIAASNGWTSGTLNLHGLVVDRNAQRLSLSLNGGIATTTTTASLGSSANGNVVRIAAASPTASYATMEFYGAAIFRRALSPAEIKLLSDYYSERIK